MSNEDFQQLFGSWSGELSDLEFQQLMQSFQPDNPESPQLQSLDPTENVLPETHISSLELKLNQLEQRFGFYSMFAI